MTPSDLIKAYSSDPINNYAMEDFSISETQDNSICGNTLTVYLKINNQWVIEWYSHVWKPQMFTLAAASMLAEVVEGEHVDTVLGRWWDYMKHELWLDVSPRRQRSTVTALLAIHNAITTRKWESSKETYEEIMEY